MLNTERNTPTMESRVLRAARAVLFPGRRPRLSADFEHGQWWITHLDSGAQWSVCDDNTRAGFCFEQVTRGDE